MSPGKKLRILVLASGRGSNLQTLLDAVVEPDYPAEISGVFSDKSDAQALERARKAGVPAVWIDPAGEDYEDRLATRSTPIPAWAPRRWTSLSFVPTPSVPETRTGSR